MSALLVIAGVACVIAAAVHGYLGEVRVIGPVSFANRQKKLVVSWIWQFSSLTWGVCGLLIAASPWLFDDRDRPLAVGLACLPLIYATIGNAWATRGRHFGWKLFFAIVLTAMTGVLYS